MRFARLTLVAAIVAGCASPTLTGRPLTWEQIQRVGEVRVEDPTWKGDSLRLPIRVIRGDDRLPIVLQFKGLASENLIHITATRDVSDKRVADVYEVLIDIPKPRRREYFVVYTNPDGAYERLREVQLPETLREKLRR